MLEEAAAQPFLQSKTILGNRIVYYDRGTGPVLLLLHGMFGDHLDWEPVLEPLSRSNRVVAVDLPGFGESDKPDLEYQFDLFVETVSVLINELRLGRPALVGNSFGAIVATLLASQSPESVKALVLVSGGGILMFTPEDLKNFDEKFTVENLRLLTPQFHEIFFSRVMFTRGEAWRRYVAKQSAKLFRPDYAAYTHVLQRAAGRAARIDVKPELKKLQLPVLLLWGDRDLVFPPDKSREVLPSMRNATTAIIRDAGHAPQLDNPTEFVERVKAFLDANTQQ